MTAPPLNPPSAERASTGNAWTCGGRAMAMGANLQGFRLASGGPIHIAKGFGEGRSVGRR